MSKLIREDNKSIEYYIQTLDSKIKELKKKKKIPEEYLEPIHTFYLETVIPWVDDFQFANIEPTPEQEEILVNRILDFYNLLNSIAN